MENGVERLQKIGLTMYEAKAYLSLLSEHITTAAKLSEKSGVPRTKIYSVLEALAHKGWIKIYSGVPLLFKAAKPEDVFERIKEEYADFLESVQMSIEEGVNDVKEKFVIKKFDLGLENLKEEMAKAKTIQISNATSDFLRKVRKAFAKDAAVKVLLFPGERKIEDGNIEYRDAEVKIVCMVRGKEVPSIAVILDENRTFTAIEDPVDHHYIVDEMLYDDCSKCFGEWYNLGWNAAEENEG
jgi:sugar-specific transcriptional regulator TrmB